MCLIALLEAQRQYLYSPTSFCQLDIFTLHSTWYLKFVFFFLQDQFDNLEKHTQWGIEYVEKYTKFVKERSEIETSYAKQIR